MRVFPDDAGFCPADGSALQHASMVPIANTKEDARLGTRLCDRYELRRVVADGGMGRVYEGIDKQTQTRVAVKVLHDDVAKDDVSLARFKREYAISSQLPHTYIVKVMDFQRDEVAGVWLLVMEFLDGEELRFTLKREKNLEPARLVRMLAQTAIGLDEAHGRQFVHRDLKPDNLFLCGTREGGDVKILDFGSVKDKNKDAKKLTVLGTTIGSPYYMAPEQAQGLDTLDARADVFALAAITYECITGTVPFTGNNGPSILLAILTKDPEPVSTRSAASKYPIPAALDDVLEEALAKNPNIRTKSVGDFATAIGRAYGFAGDHKTWACIPVAELARELATVPTPASEPNAVLGQPIPPFPAAVAADPFTVRDPFAAAPSKSVTAPMGVTPSAPPSPVLGLATQDSRVVGTRGASVAAPQSGPSDRPAGLPAGRAPWLLPVVAGVVALAVGIVAFLALAR